MKPLPERLERSAVDDEEWGFSVGVSSDGYKVTAPGMHLEYWKRKAPTREIFDAVRNAFQRLKVTRGEYQFFFSKSDTYGPGEKSLPDRIVQAIRLSPTGDASTVAVIDLVRSAVLNPSQMGGKQERRGKKVVDVPTHEPFELSDATFGDRELLIRQQEQIAQLKKQLKSARLRIGKQLSQFAQVRAAAKICKVSHGTIHNAIAAGLITRYELAGDCPVVNLLEVQAKFPNGAPMGRPPKK